MSTRTPIETLRARRAQGALAPSLGTCVFWGLMAVVTLAPLPFGSNRPWAWSLLALVVGLLALAWAAAAWRSPGLAPIAWRRHGFVTLPFVAVVIWILLQASPLAPESWRHPLWEEAATALGRALAGTISLDPAATTEGAMRLAAYGAVFFLAMQLGRDPERARQAVWTVALAGVAYAIYGLTMELGGDKLILGYPKWAYRDSLTSTFVNRNAYAVEAGLALLATLALLVESARGSGRYAVASRTGFADLLEGLPPATFLLLGATTTIATALVLSRSRGGLAATAAAIAVLALAFALRRGGGRRSLGLGIGTALGGAAVLTVSGSVLFQRISSGIGQPTGREAIHTLALDAIRDRPILGHGFGTFADVFSLYRDERFTWATPAFHEAHSTYLELACELGIPGAAVLVAVVAVIAAMCLVGAMRRRQARIYPCLGFASAALVGLQALFDFAIQMPAVAVTFAALAGIGFAQSYRTEER